MSGYIGNIPVPQATQTRQTFTATASQTSFATGGYQAGYLDVFLNGVKLVDGTDYTATNGSDVVLTTGAAASDILDVVAYTAFEVLNQNFTGGVTVDNDGATVLTVDRATSDGDIVEFQKDGTKVGSIGVGSSNNLSIGSTTANHAGLLFAEDGNNPQIIPMEAGSIQDAQVDLGLGSHRFKDLYLSGGVYLGGTGSANKLDDYEEGTWTPDLRFSGGSTGITYSQTPQGEYTKIGNMVIARGEVRLSSKGSSIGSLRIYGLPFTPSIVVDWEGGFVTNWANVRGIYSIPVPNISNGVTYCSWRAASGGVTTGAEFSDPTMTNSNIDNDFILGFTLNYRTA